MFSNKKDLTNMLSVLVYCPNDSSFLLLYDEDRNDYWIPSLKMNEKDSWKDNLHCFKKKLFDYEVINEKLLKIYKIWTLEKDYLHLIFQINLPKEIKTNCKTYSSLGKLGWYTCCQIINLKPSMRSLEILEISICYIPKIHRETGTITGEAVPMGPLTEITETDILVTSEGTVNKVYIDLLDSAGIPQEEQYDLYEDFLLHTYPCIYMNAAAFKKIMSKFSFSGDGASLFRAADVWKRDFLTFHDYLFMVAVMEPHTTHYGRLAEIRCQYIFRYYDKNGDGKMNYNDLHDMISDIEKARNLYSVQEDISKEFETVAKSINFKINSVMTFSTFYSYVLQSKIPGTPLLLRFQQSHYEVSTSGTEKSSLKVSIPRRILLTPFSKLDDTLGKSSDTGYKLLMKTTILKPGEYPFQIKDLRYLEGTMTKSVAENFNFSNTKLERIDSMDVESKINELLTALKYFCVEISDSSIFCGEMEFEQKESYTWGSAGLGKLGMILLMMCEQLKEIFDKEPRLLELDPPVYIMGDLHGNFHDLMCFEKTLWPNGVLLLPGKLLFLGDFVDRGVNSLEVVMYLFANKIQNPNKVFLVRGNHEIRDIQKLFTFQRECVAKLGSSLGTAVWKAVNDVFDMMPLAAVIDKKVFCCHGGIPPPWLCPVISAINLIPCPLVNCERQSPLAWSIMWNDPIKAVVRKSIEEMQLVSNEGFLPNIQRGTGYLFSCEALDRFLATNNLSHVVRAHEVVKAGFQVHQKGKLLTVYSSSGYCGGKNFGGCVLVADKFLRVFMVDTGINQERYI